MANEKLTEIYYKPENLWTGQKAIKLLQKESGEPLKIVKAWLAKQALWQIHLPRPKRIDYAHFYVTEVNKIHQADLLFLPHDKIYGNVYKYVLNVIDIASGYKASRPLKTKKATEVAEVFKDIYKRGPLRYPEEMHVDSVTEFKSDVGKLMKEHNVTVKRAVTRYHHRFMAFVERFNKTLAEQLFKIQDTQELNNPTKDSKTWVRHLQKIIGQLNNEKTEMIDMKPKDAIKLKEVKLNIKSYPKEKPLESDGLYRYLYEPGELEGGQQRRATDMIWSWDSFRLDKIIEDPGQRVLYYLAEGPQRAFVREELMQIPENTHPPPAYVKNW